MFAAELFRVINPYRTGIELNWTALSFVLAPMPISNRHVLQCLCWSSLTSYLVAAFEFWRLIISWKIDLDQTVGIYKNNLDWKVLTALLLFCYHVQNILNTL